MTKDDLPFEYKEIPPVTPVTKKQSESSLKKYMANKIRPVIQEDIMRLVDHVKNKRRFQSTNETLKFLCKLESECSKMHMIHEISKCPDCPTTMSAEHIGKLHNHVDGNVPCFGCLQRDYQIAMTEEDHEAVAKIIKKLNDKTNESNDENSEQTDASEHEDEDNKEEKEEKDKRLELLRTSRI